MDGGPRLTEPVLTQEVLLSAAPRRGISLGCAIPYFQ